MNNKIVLNGCIDEFIKNNELKLSESEGFEIFSLFQLTKDIDLCFDDLEDSIVDGSKDGGMDSIIIILDDDYMSTLHSIKDYKFTSNTILKIAISQAKSENSFKEAAVDKLITSFPVFLDLDQTEEQLSERFNSSIVSKRLIIQEVWVQTLMKGGRIEIDINYFCKANEIKVNDAFTSKANQLKKIIIEKTNSDFVSFNNYSSKELLDLYQKRKASRLELTFKEVPVTTDFNDGYGYVGIVNIKDYYGFITNSDNKIIESIFESNIRHYQGDVDVNNKIRGSLNDEFKIDFWWLNNGITIIAEQPSQVSKTLSLENVQIVNGLQTTFTLEKYFKEKGLSIDDERSILVKVIILDSDKNKEAIDRIISSTNSQNAVPPVLLRATDDIQRKIELFFLSKGYYYDRRKNFYKNIGKPASKIFTIQSTAQAIQSIVHFEPDTARAKPTTLIKTKESYEKIFNDNTPFEIYLSCSIVSKIIKDYIRINLEKENKSLAKAYALHLSRCLVSVVLEKSDYTKLDLKSLDVEKITDNQCATSFDILSKIIDEFKKISTTTTDSSVSKSGRFRDFLNNKIQIKFNKC